MPKNNEQQLDLQFHEPVTHDSVRRILSIIVLSARQDDNFDMCCKFLKPTEDEKQVIREVLCSLSK